MQVGTTSDILTSTSIAWLPGRASAWRRPERPDNALVATAVDAETFEALFAERVLRGL